MGWHQFLIELVLLPSLRVIPKNSKGPSGPFVLKTKYIMIDPKLNNVDLSGLDEADRNYHDKSLLEGPEPEFDENAYRQDVGGLATAHNGIADRLLKNNETYNAYKGDWSRTDWSLNKNIKTTTGREDGKFYIKREQMNVKEIADRCAAYRRAAEAGIPDPMGPYMPDGTIGYKWIDLPRVLVIRIQDQYFGGMPWAAIKRDRTLKAQFYRVVQEEYPAFVTYPGGKLPIPIDVPYPAKQGTTNFFRGADLG